MFQRTTRYTPLALSEIESQGSLSPEAETQSQSHGKHGQKKSTSLFFIACAISLILSAVNISLLSMANTHQALTEIIKTPTVYMGLERVADRMACHSRVTFPKTFAIFTGGDLKSMTKIHAPDDKMFLSFGEQISAYVEFYLPDFGLENCTMTAWQPEARSSAPQPGLFPTIDIYLLPNRAQLSRKVLAGTVELKPGVRSTTPPFFCPGRTHMQFVWTCPNQGCKIHFPLQGVTSMTAPVGSNELTQTGLSITQYEGLDCILTE